MHAVKTLFGFTSDEPAEIEIVYTRIHYQLSKGEIECTTCFPDTCTNSRHSC